MQTNKVYFITLLVKKYNMARFKITTKHVRNCNGIRIEPGMSVEVITQSMSNPVSTNGGQLVIDAFYRIYGIDIKKPDA